MKQVLIASILFLSLAITGTSQNSYSHYNGKKWEQISGNGKLVKLAPVVSAFTNLDISHMNAQVIVEAGAAVYALDVTIDENLKDFFRYRQEGNTLQLSFDLSGGKYDRWLSSNNTVVTIKVPALESLNNNGNTTIELKQLNQKAFKLISSGNADIKLSGTVNEVLLQTTGNSDINAGALTAEKTTLSSSGNADIVVNTKELLETNMNGNNEVTNLFGNPNVVTHKKTALEFVRFKLRNNSVLPTKLSVISYRPDEKGNGTTAFVMLPYGTRTYRFPVGTKIYLATQEQVNTVMSGAKISDQPPFLQVKKEDNNKTLINNLLV
jgi:Putative auto-transporter adhesin, head GIN domain